VALAAIKGDRTIAQLAEQFDVHPNQVTLWKAQLEGGAADVFGQAT
jgi:transposase-like protein